MFPPGDLVSCMAAFYKGKHAFLPSLLTYRFPGNRYGKDTQLSGHKLGNLIMAGLIKDSQTFDEAIGKFQALFAIEGEFIPATDTQVSISAITVEGKEIVGEESIDLGRYNGQRVLESVKLHPRDAKQAKKKKKKKGGSGVGGGCGSPFWFFSHTNEPPPVVFFFFFFFFGLCGVS